MTYSEFVTTAPTLPAGITVVSCPDLSRAFLLLLEARDAIVATSRTCVVIDAKALVEYPSDDSERGVDFEYLVTSAPNTVYLVPNQFDRTDLVQNTTNQTLIIDVAYDIATNKHVDTIPEATSLIFPGTRKLFAYMSRLFYYDTYTGEISFVKSQDSLR